MGNHLILGSLLKTMHILNVSKRFMLWFCAPLSPRSIPECHNISETGIMQWCHGESWEGFQNRDNKRVILSTHTFPGPGSDLTGGGGGDRDHHGDRGLRWSPLVTAGQGPSFRSRLRSLWRALPPSLCGPFILFSHIRLYFPATALHQLAQAPDNKSPSPGRLEQATFTYPLTALEPHQGSQGAGTAVLGWLSPGPQVGVFSPHPHPWRQSSGASLRVRAAVLSDRGSALITPVNLNYLREGLVADIYVGGGKLQQRNLTRVFHTTNPLHGE